MPAKLGVGRLNRRVVLEAPDDASGYAAGKTTYSVVATVWAAVEPLSVRDLVAAQQAQSQTTHRITIRYRAGVTSSFRVGCGGRTFTLTGPPRDPEERHEFLELMCVERA